MRNGGFGMTIRMRAYEPRDSERIPALLASQSPATPHLLDLPWRLSSHVVGVTRDAMLWEDETGTLLGPAAWQQPWAALDFFVRPGPMQREVESQLFAWAHTRFQAMDRERGAPLPYWVE